MAYSQATTAYKGVLSRLDRGGTSPPASLEKYYKGRINYAVIQLEGRGITLGADDLGLVIDYAVWLIQNRDKDTDMPQWLRYAINQRWLQERREATDNDT